MLHALCLITAERNHPMTPKVNEGAARIGGFTHACRLICTVMVAGPVLYVSLVTKGDAYHFLALVLIAPVAGLVLAANSLFCLFRYRNVESSWIGLAFVVVGVTGILETWYFLPQFRMG